MAQSQHKNSTLIAREVFFITNWSPRRGKLERLYDYLSRRNTTRGVRDLESKIVVVTAEKVKVSL
jgi:hypothetical protein